MRLLVLLMLPLCLLSQNRAKPRQVRILFVFDASRSMSTKLDNTTRMDGAKQLFFKFVDSLKKDRNLQFALRMYGHTVKYPPGDCKDSKLVVPFGGDNVELIKQKVREAKPTGITPIEHSLTEAANDFKDNKTENIVIIITDGIEECGGDPCAARKKLMEKGIIFKPFIIGIGLTPEQIKTFECVGTYYNYEDSETFTNITNIIQNQQLNKTTVQVNLLDVTFRPLETNVNVTFVDVNRDAYKYNYIHTMNRAGKPDTLTIDDYPSYKVIAHTIPPAESQVTKLSPGKHNVIAIDAPQGELVIERNFGPYNFNEKTRCVVRRSSQGKILNVQPLNGNERYLIGTYDVEVLTLPRTMLRNVEISQSRTASRTVANAGMLKVKTTEAGDGCIMVKRGDRLEWVCQLSYQTSQVFYLQPGSYVAVWRAKSLKGSIYTIEKKFTIVSDQDTTIEFYKN